MLNISRLLQEKASSYLSSHDGGPEFAEVFVIVWVGAMVVTINTKLLGGTMYKANYQFINKANLY